MNKGKNRIVGVITVAGDFLLFYLSLYLALWIRKGGSPDPGAFTSLQEPFLYLFLIWVFVLFVIDFYELSSFKKTVSFLRGVVVFLALATASGTVYFYFQPQLGLTPRAVLFLTVLNFAILSSFWRYLLLLVIGSKNFRKKVFFIGFCQEMIEVLDEEALDYDVVGIYTKEKVPERIESKIAVTGDISEVKSIARDAEVLVIAPGVRDDTRTVKTIFSSLSLDVNYMEFFAFYEEVMKKVPLLSINEWWFLENISRPRKKMGEAVSRIMEVTVSFIGLALLVLVFPFVSFLILIDSRGPVIYRQKRVGESGKKFVLCKFRTMYRAEKKEETPWREGEKGSVTRVGSFLRRTHIDEFPQLYNIIKGDLSFTGPRPETVEFATKFEKEIPFYRLRYLVRPGLTGWAQINYPPSMSIKEAEEKFKYDLYYIKNRSFFFDIAIILKTLRTVF